LCIYVHTSEERVNPKERTYGFSDKFVLHRGYSLWYTHAVFNKKGKIHKDCSEKKTIFHVSRETLCGDKKIKVL